MSSLFPRKEHANASIGRKFTSLFPGLGYAAGYKVRVTRTGKSGSAGNLSKTQSAIGTPSFVNNPNLTRVWLLINRLASKHRLIADP
jgi:hypothetical protein